MIDKTLTFLLGELNAYLFNRFGDDRAHAVLSAIVKQDGTVPEETANKIVLTLINIEREAAAANAAPQYRVEQDSLARVSPPLNVNLLLLISASFEANYAESFKLLSAVLGFFQSRPVFTPQSAPDLPRELEKLSFHWVDMDLQAINNLWSVLGSHYLPSVVYKARMLTIQDAWIQDLAPPITGIGLKS